MKNILFILILVFTQVANAQVYSPPPLPSGTTYYYQTSSGTQYGHCNGYRYYYAGNYRYQNPYYNYYLPVFGMLMGQALVNLVSYAIYEKNVVWQERNTTYQAEAIPLLGWKYVWDGTQWVYQQIVTGYTWYNGSAWIQYHYPIQ